MAAERAHERLRGCFAGLTRAMEEGQPLRGDLLEEALQVATSAADEALRRE